MVCLLLSSSARPSVKKNWLPLSWGPAFAMATSPRRLKRNREWNSSWSIKKKRFSEWPQWWAPSYSFNQQDSINLLIKNAEVVFNCFSSLTISNIYYFFNAIKLDFSSLYLLNVFRYKFSLFRGNLPTYTDKGYLKRNGFLSHSTIFPSLKVI